MTFSCTDLTRLNCENNKNKGEITPKKYFNSQQLLFERFDADFATSFELGGRFPPTVDRERLQYGNLQWD